MPASSQAPDNCSHSRGTPQLKLRNGTKAPVAEACDAASSSQRPRPPLRTIASILFMVVHLWSLMFFHFFVGLWAQFWYHALSALRKLCCSPLQFFWGDRVEWSRVNSPLAPNGA